MKDGYTAAASLSNHGPGAPREATIRFHAREGADQMPYVTRDAALRVVGLSETVPSEGGEFLPATHPDVLDFLFRDSSGERASARFLASDLGFIRVVEDLVALLIEKRAITLTDLPAAAQDKLLERRSLRSYLSDVSGVFEGGEGKII